MDYDAIGEQCTDGVQSAAWFDDGSADGAIDYDFGADTLYFEVIAANFTDEFTPSFRIAGLTGDQTADLDYGIVLGTYNVNVTTGSGNGDYPGSVVTTNETNTSLGVSIYVRLIIHNNDTEGLAMIPITLSVDAVNAAGQDDVNHVDCSVNGAFADAATQNVNPRPAIAPVAPGVFLPVNP